MNLAVLTCAWQRYDIFESFLQHIPKDITVICAGDDDSNKTAFEKSGLKGTYLIYQNKPVSNKWNAALKEAQKFEFDYLIITGSDDFFSDDLWEWYKTLDVHYAGILDFYFLEQKTGRVKYNDGFRFNRKGEPHGAGRAIHRTVLESCNWTLWENGKNEGLDASMTETLNKFKLSYQFINLKSKGFVALDVKTPENIHKVSEYQGQWVDEDEKRYLYSKLAWI